MRSLDMILVYTSRSDVEYRFEHNHLVYYSLHMRIRNYFSDSIIYNADDEFSVMDEILEIFGVTENET